MNDQAQAVGDESIAEQMASLLEAEEATPEDDEQIEADSSEEAEPTEETEPEEGDEDSEMQEDTLVLNWNGEDRQFKRSEVVELAQKGFDYTQKTQQLAEQRRTLEAQANLNQQQAQLNAFAADKMAEIKSLDNQIAQYKEVDWLGLAQSDPMQYLTLNQTFQALKYSRNEVMGEYHTQVQQITQAQQTQRGQILEAEIRLMAEKIPEMRAGKAQQTQGELKSYLADEGFSAEEIAGIIDHRIVKVAIAAMKFQKLQTAQPGIKKRMAEAPKVVKGKQPAPNNATRDLRDRARKGDEKAIVALLERSL